ncbi:hypothetical protein SAY87_004940 [Trapa incisa]|uniref:Uncharacterized protein n=1 Tax=Trapa incisa TaxID=236973 RepID=A0AAN7PNW5_9MYRT|nr:hypothetical protein SAY87_004940 [Trapa incisa]
MKHCVGSFEMIAGGSSRPHEPRYTEDLGRVEGPNFYYSLEDILVEETEKRDGVS